MALRDLRIVERTGQPDDDGVVGLAERSRVAAGYAQHLLIVEQALGPQEADRQLAFVAGRPHRDRDRDRILARAGRADLERRLADDPIVADLERRTAHRDDPAAGHVPNGWQWVAVQAGHVVVSTARPNASSAVPAAWAASSASPNA